MTTARRTWLVWGGLALLLVARADAAVIELRDQVQLSDAAVIRLGDVARVVEADPQRTAELSQITLAPAPAAGRQARLQHDDIRARLLATGVNLAGVEFRGRSFVLVSGATSGRATKVAVKPAAAAAATSVQTRRAEELLTAAFQRQFQPANAAVSGLRVRFELTPEQTGQILAAEAERIEFVDPVLRSGGPQALAVRCPQTGGGDVSVSVTAWVTPAPRALGVRYALPKGHVLTADDLVWSAAADGEAGIQRLGDAIGKETTRPLKSGQLLSPGDLTLIPLVRANDNVTVVVRRPGLTVRRPFKALSTGGLNETVHLAALDDPRQRIQAVVTGYHEATLSGETTESRDLIQDATGVIRFEPAASAAPREGARR